MSSTDTMEQAPKLLLLPFLPTHLSPSLEIILPTLADSALDIAIRWDDLEGVPRSELYEAAQKGLASIYMLLCNPRIIGSQYQVDFRIFLVDKNNNASPEDLEISGVELTQGPFWSVSSVARSYRPWSDVFVLDGEESELFLQHFSKLRSPLVGKVARYNVHQVSSGPILKLRGNGDDVKTHEGKRHLSVAVGGTFDHLHAGHKLLLTATALLVEPYQNINHPPARCLTVGITGDELLKNKKFAELLESWEERATAAYKFLSSIMYFGQPDWIQFSSTSNPGPNGNSLMWELPGRLTIRCVEISDPFGPTITDESITALVVSGETRSGGKAVNDKREGKGWNQLEIFEVDVLDSKDEEGTTKTVDFSSKISSTEIRRLLHKRQSESGDE